MFPKAGVFLALVLVAAALEVDWTYDEHAIMNEMMPIKTKEWKELEKQGLLPVRAPPLSDVPCVNGKADVYSCDKVDLLSFTPLLDLGTRRNGNDIWGWADQGKEYAIFCAEDGTTFVDVTNPKNPDVLGRLPTKTTATAWRDAKVYKDHVFIVAESRDHGMQVYALKQLHNLPRGRNSSEAVPVLTESAWYSQVTSVHNIAINEDTGFAYLVGSRTCNAGLHMVDIRSPLEPKFAGCFGSDGYTHDTECIVYDGPDAKHRGKEICFAYNEDTLTIVDVTVKTAPVMLARVPYERSQYTHQGWLTPDRKFILMNDELDELYGVPQDRRTRTLVWDVSNLDKPEYVFDFWSTEQSIDHNLYILGNTGFLSNYCAGLRVMDLRNIDAHPNPSISQSGFFDVAPTCSTTDFLGTWSNYPYLPSGNVIVSTIDRGLFVLRLHDDIAPKV